MHLAPRLTGILAAAAFGLTGFAVPGFAQGPGDPPTIALDIGPRVATSEPTAKASRAAREKAATTNTLPALWLPSDQPAPLEAEHEFGVGLGVDHSLRPPVTENLVPGPPTSTSIDHLGDGHGARLVVPLFRLLNSLSNAPPPPQ